MAEPLNKFRRKRNVVFKADAEVFLWEVGGVLAGGEVDEGSSKAVEVGGGDGSVAKLFDGHVSVGADDGAGTAVALHGLYGAEVDEEELFYFLGRREWGVWSGEWGAKEEVAGFDVAVDDGGLLVVEIDEDFEDVLGDGFELGFGEAVAFVDVLAEGVGGDEALDEGKAFAAFGFDIEVVEVTGNGRVV